MKSECECSKVRVLFAVEADIPGVLAVQAENLLENKLGKNDQEKVSGGFLIHPVSESELTQVINHPRSHVLIVAKDKTNILGYILGYDLGAWKKIKPNWQPSKVSEKVGEILKSERVLYMRHIARKPEALGVGGDLLEAIYREAVRRSYSHAVAEILLKPLRNGASITFAKKSGLALSGQIYDGERVWGLFMKEL